MDGVGQTMNGVDSRACRAWSKVTAMPRPKLKFGIAVEGAREGGEWSPHQ